MSKRLQVLLPEKDYRALAVVSRKESKTIAEWVRDSIRRRLKVVEPPSPEKKLSKILKYARYSGPTGDIEQILSEIEKGRENHR